MSINRLRPRGHRRVAWERTQGRNRGPGRRAPGIRFWSAFR